MSSKKVVLPCLTLSVSYNDNEIRLSIKGTLGSMLLCNVNMNEFASIAQLLHFLIQFYADYIYLKRQPSIWHFGFSDIQGQFSPKYP